MAYTVGGAGEPGTSNGASTLGEGATGLGDQSCELIGQRLDPRLKRTQARDQVTRELLAGRGGRRGGSNTAQQGGRLAAGQASLGAAGDQVTQQPVQPVHTAGVLADQVVAMVADQANHGRGVFGL